MNEARTGRPVAKRPMRGSPARRMAGSPLAGSLRFARGIAFLPAACALAVGGLLHAAAPSAEAAEFTSGPLQGSFDTTLSHGVTIRTGARDDSLTGLNSDDGGRNYGGGIVSNTSKITGELELDYGSFGAFARVNGFIDFENENGRREHRPLTEDAKDLVGKDFEVLDLYVTGAFDAGDAAVDVRLGNHVLNWGESTFIQNGVNVVNPFDVARLRTPGAELREALVPVPLLSASVAPTSALSLEGFYQLDWKKTEIDPTGTYFSTNDYAGAGGSRAYLSDPRFTAGAPPILTDRGGPTPGSSLSGLIGAGAINADLAAFAGTPQGMALRMDCRPTSAGPPPTFAGRDCQDSFDPGFLSVSRSPDREPDDSGQWGIAVRYLAESLNDTEFGFYFVNHHSRLPLASAIYGTQLGYARGLAAAGALGAPGSNTIQAITSQATPLVTQGVTQAFTQRITDAVTAAVPAGTPQSVIDGQVAARLALPATQQQMAAEIQRQVQSQVTAGVGGASAALAIDRYAKTASYRIEYPEDLQVLGVSFNTQLGASGWALQGEYSFHPDAPLQRTETSLFTEGLLPLTTALALSAAGRNPNDPGNNPYLGLLGEPLRGYVERDVSQLQVTATKVLGPVAGADGMAFITEAAVMHVHGMPDESTTPLDSGGVGEEIADATSFGYRAAARLDYHNAIGAARLSPYVQYQHDLGGSSPGPGGPFVEGRRVLTLGVGVNYLERWRGSLGWTMHSGGNNQLSDRDFIAASVSYSF